MDSSVNDTSLDRSSLRKADFLREIPQKRTKRGRFVAGSDAVADSGAVAIVEERSDGAKPLASHEVIVGSEAVLVDERAGLRGTVVGTWIIRTHVGMLGRRGVTTIEEIIVIDALVMLFVDDDDVRVLTP